MKNNESKQLNVNNTEPKWIGKSSWEGQNSLCRIAEHFKEEEEEEEEGEVGIRI